MKKVPQRQGAPSNGKYAKKTLPSAQDGNMIYYENGLDFKPKSMQDGGWVDKYDLPQLKDGGPDDPYHPITNPNGKKPAPVPLGFSLLPSPKAKFIPVKSNPIRGNVSDTPDPLAQSRGLTFDQIKWKPKPQPTIGPARAHTIDEERLHRARLEQYAYENPNAVLGEDNQLRTRNPDRTLTGRAHPYTRAAANDKALTHAAHALDAAMWATGAGELGVKGAQALGKYLTENTLLKNTYKLNPFAFKPSAEMMYRGIGREGMEDALASGVFRAKQNVNPQFTEGIDLAKQFEKPFYSPNYQTADTYGGGFIAEVPKDAATFTNRYSNKPWSQYADIDIPVNQGKILQKNWLKGYKEVPTQPLGTASLSDIEKGVAGYINRAGESTLSAAAETLGTLKPGRQAAIEEGNAWLNNWIKNPATQNKMELDYMQARLRAREADKAAAQAGNQTAYEEAVKADYMHSKNYTPDVREYSLNKGLGDYADIMMGVEKNMMHADNWGVSWGHQEDSFLENYIKALGIESKSPYQGAYISRNPLMSNAKRASTVTHEGTHEWVRDKLLKSTQQHNEVLQALTPYSRSNTVKWSQLRNEGIDPKLKMTKAQREHGYLADPAEVHARIMELRKQYKLTPDQHITEEMGTDILHDVLKKKTIVDPKFGKVIKDGKKFADLFNNLWAVPAGVVGVGAATQQKDGGWLNKYDHGGVIEDDMGQWKYPGQVTKIKSTDITMRGVPHPVLGVSDTGDTQMMFPERDYKFKGKSVTEYPQAQTGKTIYTADPNRYNSYLDSTYSHDWSNRLLSKYKQVAGEDVVPVKRGTIYDNMLRKEIKPETLMDNSDEVAVKELRPLMKEYQRKANKNIKPTDFEAFIGNPDKGVKDLITGRAFMNMFGVLERTPGARIPMFPPPKEKVIYDPNYKAPTPEVKAKPAVKPKVVPKPKPTLKRNNFIPEREELTPGTPGIISTPRGESMPQGSIKNLPYRVEYHDGKKMTHTYFADDKEGAKFMNELQNRPFGLVNYASGYYETPPKKKFGGMVKNNYIPAELDQLMNFTNKPTTGGWLDKY